MSFWLKVCIYSHTRGVNLYAFQNRAAPFQLVPAKNICFGSDYHVYLAEIMRFKPY